MLTPIQFTQFVLSAPSGQGEDRDTAMIVNTVGAAMSNISEELKNIRELVGRLSLLAKPAIPLFLDPNYRASLSDMLGNDATDDFIVQLNAANQEKAQKLAQAYQGCEGGDQRAPSGGKDWGEELTRTKNVVRTVVSKAL